MKKAIQQFTVAANVELREEGEKRTVVGVIPYNSRSVKMWGGYEIITDSAFAKTLADGADVKALFCHDSSKILGRTKNSTLKLSNGMIGEVSGLLCECELSDTSYARDLYALIKRGDVNTMSFGFYPIQERIEVDGDDELRYLLEVKLIEVSFGVAFPAYEETTSVAREIRGVNLDALEAVLSKAPETLSTEDRSVLENVNKTISTLIEPSPSPDTVAARSTTAADFAASLLAASIKE